jgi:hypothetical protein
MRVRLLGDNIQPFTIVTQSRGGAAHASLT